MKKALVFLVLLSGLLAGRSAKAEVLPLTDPKRLSMGLSVVANFQQNSVVDNKFSHTYDVGLPMAWQITSRGATPYPLSISFRPGYDLTLHKFEARIGLTMLLKKAE